MFNYILPWIKSRKNEKNDYNLDRVHNLVNKLNKLGYNFSEIDYMIMMVTGNKKINSLNVEEIKKVEVALNEQLRIGSKCIELISSKNK